MSRVTQHSIVMSPSVIATHICLARTRPALVANGRLFADDTPLHDTAIGLDLGIRPKIVFANHTFKFSNAGISQRTTNFITSVGCVGLFDVGVMVVRLDVIDCLLLHIVKRCRLAVRLARVREMASREGTAHLYKSLGGGGEVFIPSRGAVDEGGRGMGRAFPFLSVGLVERQKSVPYVRIRKRNDLSVGGASASGLMWGGRERGKARTHTGRQLEVERVGKALAALVRAAAALNDNMASIK